LKNSSEAHGKSHQLNDISVKYFFFHNTGDEKIVGDLYPQCKGMPTCMGLTSKWFEQPNSMTKLNNEDFPNFEPELIFELEDNAILTDVVSPSNVSAKGFLINPKVSDIFSHFNLIEHRYYPAIIIVKGKKLPYYWLHFKDNNDFFLENIDYEKSIFHVSNLAYMKINDVEINSYQEYIKFRKSLSMKYISASKLALTDEFKKKEFDLFYFGHMFLNCFISLRLVEALKIHNVTGLDFNEQNIL
jgi:hypothetical protein